MIPTRLRLGRIFLVVVSAAILVLGGTTALLLTQGKPPVSPAGDSLVAPAWAKEKVEYPPTPPEPVKGAAVPPDRFAELLAKQAALDALLRQQQQEIDALKKRPVVTPALTPPPAKAASAPPVKKVAAPMLFVEHQVKEETGKVKEAEYTILPGGYIPCLIETAMNSDTGDIVFVSVVSSTVYDTASGRHPLIPQGSKIVGEGKGSTLVYGNELLRTVGLTLSRRQDTTPIDLGQAPVTNQIGINGLASRVDSHFWRLVGAVFIGGALRGGAVAVQTAIANTGPVGQVSGGIAQSGQQAITQRTGPLLNTRPTIEVDPGQECNVVITKPLHLTVAQ